MQWSLLNRYVGWGFDSPIKWGGARFSSQVQRVCLGREVHLTMVLAAGQTCVLISGLISRVTFTVFLKSIHFCRTLWKSVQFTLQTIYSTKKTTPEPGRTIWRKKCGQQASSSEERWWKRQPKTGLGGKEWHVTCTSLGMTVRRRQLIALIWSRGIQLLVIKDCHRFVVERIAWH